MLRPKKKITLQTEVRELHRLADITNNLQKHKPQIEKEKKMYAAKTVSI